MKSILPLLILLIAVSVNGQQYDDLISKADSCYKAKAYKEATDYFRQAFRIRPESQKNYYNAACVASLANDKDTAILWLEKAIAFGFDNYNHISKDSDLDNLRSDTRFLKMVAKLKEQSDRIEANYDKPLQKELLEIFQEDQEIRYQYIAAQNKYGNQSKEADSIGDLMEQKDRLNLIKIRKILDEKGWVGKDKVGQQANQTLFLVIQHSDLKVQQTYLPMMREAVKKGNAMASSLALLEDRVAIGEGRMQIYGSQIGTKPDNSHYVLPLEDPDHVDQRRAGVGLGPLAEYVKNWNIVWNVEQYKKDLPELKALLQSKK